MAPIATLLGAALSLTTHISSLQSWPQATTTPIGSSTTQLTRGFKVGPRLATSASMTTSPITAAASTLPSSSVTASSVEVLTTNLSLELRQTKGTCDTGYVSCTTPGEVVCVGDEKFGICATNNCAMVQDLAAGVDCEIFSPENMYTSVASPPLSTTFASLVTQVSLATSLATSSPMRVTRSSLAVSTLATRTAPSAKPQSSPGTPTGPPPREYTMYTGNGTTFPNNDSWVGSFDDLWTMNLNSLINTSCAPFGANTDAESDAIKSSVLSAASGSGLDPRFILAIVMQESRGCVRVQATIGAHNNPGLMQDYEGPYSCNVGGAMTTPCPGSTIQGMINDGVFGNVAPGQAKGAGLVQNYHAADQTKPVSDGARYYIAARMYNSGSYVDGDLGCGVATHCYASDVANRLMGYTGDDTPCTDAQALAHCPTS